MHVRFNFYCILFRLLYAKHRGINVKIEGFMENATFSHEIHIKDHSLKYISRLEQTNNLISKLNKLRYWKKYQKFR